MPLCDRDQARIDQRRVLSTKGAVTVVCADIEAGDA